MIKAWTFVAALHVFIIAIALLVVINTANASAIVGFDVTMPSAPGGAIFTQAVTFNITVSEN